MSSANIRVRGELLSDLICQHVHHICKQDSELILDGFLLRTHTSLLSRCVLTHVPYHPLILFLSLPTSSYDITVPLFEPHRMLSLDPRRHGATLSLHQHCQSENRTCRTSFQILSLQAIFPILRVQPFIQLTISLFLFLCSTALSVVQLDSGHSSLLSSLPRLSHIFLADFFPSTAFLYFLTPLPSLLVVFSPSRGYIKHLLGSSPFHFSCTFQVIW